MSTLSDMLFFSIPLFEKIQRTHLYFKILTGFLIEKQAVLNIVNICGSSGLNYKHIYFYIRENYFIAICILELNPVLYYCSSYPGLCISRFRLKHILLIGISPSFSNRPYSGLIDMKYDDLPVIFFITLEFYNVVFLTLNFILFCKLIHIFEF